MSNGGRHANFILEVESTHCSMGQSRDTVLVAVERHSTPSSGSGWPRSSKELGPAPASIPLLWVLAAVQKRVDGIMERCEGGFLVCILCKYRSKPGAEVPNCPRFASIRFVARAAQATGLLRRTIFFLGQSSVSFDDFPRDLTLSEVFWRKVVLKYWIV